MALIDLPKSQSILELKLWGRWRYFDEVQRMGSSPGFGHSLDVIVGFIRHCVTNNLYPIINDDDWWYGKWTDFFNPFCEEEEKKERIANCASKEVVDIEDVKTGYGGQYVHKDALFYEILEKIYDIRFDVQSKMSAHLAQYENADIALHIRVKYENDLNWNLEAYRHAFDQYLKDSEVIKDLQTIFLLTDDFSSVAFCKEYFQCNVNTLCTSTFDGSASRTGNNLLQLLTEIEIAKSARYFVGSQYSSIPRLISFFRKEKNVHILPIYPNR